MKFKDYGVITYPKYIDTSSLYLGKLRDLIHTEMNEASPRFKRGDRSEHVNILGIKGELIVENFVFSQNLEYTTPPLIADTPIAEPDIIIEKKFKIDIKAVTENAPNLLVNYEAHNKCKGITHYWFVQPFLTGKANYWIFKFEDVDNWKIKDVKYSDAYYINISDLINEKTKNNSSI